MIKIAIVGPESTGKTELAEQLAAYYNTRWIPEYARSYVEQLGNSYSFEDVEHIAQQQIEEEEEILKSDCAIVFFDTDLIITKVWFDYCYDTVPEFVTNRLNERFIDYYLLCLPDLPWQPDSVREHGDDRDYFFNWYEKEIKQLGTPYVIVGGIGNDRLKNAIEQLTIFIEQNSVL